MAAAPQDDSPRCRFCLDDDPAELVDACACTSPVHLRCLRTWQRHQPRPPPPPLASAAAPPPPPPPPAACEVCRQPWRLPLDPLDRLSWLRSLRTSPSYRPASPSALSPSLEARLRAMMRPGVLIVQTPWQAARAAPRLHAPPPPPLPPLAPPLASHHSLAAILATVLQRRSSHWLHGAYLIVHAAADAASDGSTALCALNLTQPHHDEPLRSDLAAALGAPVRALSGGPCQRAHPLCLLALDGGEELPRTAGWRGDAVRLPAPRGGGEELWLLEADVAARLRQLIPPEARGVRGALLVRGCAIWSSTQLAAEISRHSWGLCEAHYDDLPFAAAAADAPADSAAGLWSRCWEERAPLHAENPPPPSPPEEESASPPPLRIDSRMRSLVREWRWRSSTGREE
ncbi:hypothetical protein AB1Y20_020820 [Prymnesium parvum]|uniref:RING-CH-type domain-containing protein n=1 Tax=Prymnesium parvum TaxID=97485 RepID=A0AB34JVT4_PRYPA